MLKQALAGAELHTISEAEFVKLCDDLYADRHQIYEYNPGASRREALLWMLLGCLINLLSVPPSEQPPAYGDSSSDPYVDAVCEILQQRMRPPFDARAYLALLSKKIEAGSD